MLIVGEFKNAHLNETLEQQTLFLEDFSSSADLSGYVGNGTFVIEPRSVSAPVSFMLVSFA